MTRHELNTMLAATVRAARLQKGLLQFNIATITAIPTGDISSYELNNKSMSLNIMVRFIAALDIKLVLNDVIYTIKERSDLDKLVSELIQKDRLAKGVTFRAYAKELGYDHSVVQRAASKGAYSITFLTRLITVSGSTLSLKIA